VSSAEPDAYGVGTATATASIVVVIVIVVIIVVSAARGKWVLHVPHTHALVLTTAHRIATAGRGRNEGMEERKAGKRREGL
jgi:uncharacterized membrane protein YqiK